MIAQARTEAGSTWSWAAWRVYLRERFPVPVMLLISSALALGAYASAQSDELRAGARLLVDGAGWAGIAIVFAFLLLMRVFDEHKDYELDCATRPDRAVQRGLISLRQLKLVGVGAFAVQAVLAAMPGFEPALLYAAVLAYSGLMYFEFFAPRWLESRMLIYALSHSLVVVLLVVALASRFGTGAAMAVPAETWLFGGLAFCGFMAIDVLRKIWAPETERDGVNSYSKRFGLRGAAAVATAVLGGAGGFGGRVGWRLGGGLPWLVVVGVVTVWAVFEVFAFAARPRPEREGRLQAVAGVHVLVTFLGVAIVAALHSGVLLTAGELSLSIGGSR